MYLWLKALHIIFIVCWFAGIFYLPRIFVNIAMAEDAASKKQLNQMAHKLYRFITPFMWLTIFFGGWLLINNWDGYRTALWLHIKMALVILLVIYHLQCGRFQRQLAQRQNQHSHKFFRFFNELPVFALFAIVILAVVKPF